jgi:hypothetical protein
MVFTGINSLGTTYNYPRLCGNLGHRSQKMVLGTSFPEFNPDKFPLL